MADTQATRRAAAGRCRRSGSCRRPAEPAAQRATLTCRRSQRIARTGEHRSSAWRRDESRRHRRERRALRDARRPRSTGRCSYGHASGIDRNAAQQPRGDQFLDQPCGMRPVRALNRAQDFVERVDRVHRVELRETQCRRASPSTPPRRTSRICRHNWRAESRLPRSECMDAAVDFSQIGEPGTCDARSSHSRALARNRGCASNTRTRCRACIPSDPAIASTPRSSSDTA